MVQTRERNQMGLVFAASAAIVGLLANAIAQGAPTAAEDICRSNSNNTTSDNSILSIFARDGFEWSSTPSLAGQSATVVLAQSILADKNALPSGLDDAVLTVLDIDGKEQVLDVQVSRIRDVVSSQLLHEVRRLCDSQASFSGGGGGGGCNPNEADPVFGTTPLHLAELWGSRDLVDYLLSIGANPELYDSAGRQPRDRAFQDFAANSKKRAAEAHLPDGADPQERCEIPEVVIPLFPDVALDSTSRTPEETAAVQDWRIASNAALSEVRRLASEGVPIMTRNVVPWVLADSRELEGHQNMSRLQYPDASTFTKSWGHRSVDVGSVSYANSFERTVERMTLDEYDATATAAAAVPADTASGKYYTPRAPHFVSQMDPEACAEGRELLGKFVEAALPSSGHNPVVCPPPSGLLGMQKVQFYQGETWSGAPFHMHSDALNMVVAGKKRWLWVTPRSAVWTRRHIQEYTGEDKGRPWKDFAEFEAGDLGSSEQDQLMECIQHPGDVMYIAGGWGHASLNIADGTFGYTLGLLNLRDSLGSVLGLGCERSEDGQ